MRLSLRLLFLPLCLLLGLPALAYPPAEWHRFDSVAQFAITVPAFGLDNVPLTAVGPTHIRLGDPYDPGDGLIKINTEIEHMVLSGDTPLGPAVLRVLTPAPGCIQQKQPGVDFPANSWFDVTIEIVVQTPNGPITVYSDPAKPVRMMAMIDSLPPFDSEYAPAETFVGVDLVDPAGNVIGTLAHAGHIVGQQPTFSVAPGGPSGLDPADLFRRKTAPVIRAAGLSLGAGDDIDGLSYGLDFILPPFLDSQGEVVESIIDIRFSVNEGSQGRLGSHVRREAGNSEQTADEFRVGPEFAGSGGGSNIQVLDDNGDTSPALPLDVADNLDALAEQPPDFADPDNDGVPNRDIYYSLAAGSPALAAVSPPLVDHSAADILVSSNGGAPQVFISATELGLDPESDDIDALCVNALFRAAVFSLAGSADLTFFFQGRSFPWATAANLGLEPGDDVNALKCHVGEVRAFWDGSFESNLYNNGEPAGEINIGNVESEIAFGTGRGGSSTGLIGSLKSKDAAGNQISLDTRYPPVIRQDGDSTKASLALKFDINGSSLLGQEPLHLSGPAGLGSALWQGGSDTQEEVGQGTVLYQLVNQDGSPSPFALGDIRFAFDARPASEFTAESVVDAAGFRPMPSPGGLASFFGTFPTGRAAASAIPLPRRDADGVEVLFAATSAAAAIGKQQVKGQAATAMIPAPLLFVDPTQINVQIPWEVDTSTGTVTAVVRANGVDSDPIEVPIAPTSPGIFTTSFGVGPGIVINGDGTLAQPNGAIGASHPAAIGNVVVLLVSGLGETTPPGVTGGDSFDSSGAFVRRDTAQPVRVLVGGVEAPVAFAGLSPQFVGVFQINLTVPAGVVPGDTVSIVVEVGGRQSRADVTFAVAP